MVFDHNVDMYVYNYHTYRYVAYHYMYVPLVQCSMTVQ